MTTTRQYAAKGNGQNEEVSAEQLGKMQAVYAKLKQDARFVQFPQLEELFDLETTRRYLVARQWDERKALAQLMESITFFIKQQPWTFRMQDSPGCVHDPYSRSTRIVGMDSLHRPVIFAEFRHALSRTNVQYNVAHFELALEETRRIIRKQFQRGVTNEARQLQLVLVVHFAGFGMQDMSLRTLTEVIKLLAHFPEFLGQAILVDAPGLFSGVWSSINGLLDDRVRAKVQFLSLKDMPNVVRERIGSEMTDWLEAEIKSSLAHDTKRQGRREYWRVPTSPGEHDARGTASYLASDLYVKTPGDAWRERKD